MQRRKGGGRLWGLSAAFAVLTTFVTAVLLLNCSIDKNILPKQLLNASSSGTTAGGRQRREIRVPSQPCAEEKGPWKALDTSLDISTFLELLVYVE